MVTPVSTAAASAGRAARVGTPPTKTSVPSPAETTTIPSNRRADRCSPANTAPASATSSGDVPRAIGYTCPKSPSR